MTTSTLQPKYQQTSRFPDVPRLLSCPTLASHLVLHSPYHNIGDIRLVPCYHLPTSSRRARSRAAAYLAFLHLPVTPVEVPVQVPVVTPQQEAAILALPLFLTT